MATGGEGTLSVQTVTETYKVDDLEEEITCAVCQEHFQDPKILPCCHYYCKRCVQALVDAASTKDKNSFLCPECRKDTTIPENDPDKLQTAFFVNRMKALYTKREKTFGRVEAYCEQCSSQVAMAFCRQCAEFICDKCTDAHKRMKAFTSHRVSTLEELKEGSLKELPAEKPPPPPTCGVHDELMKIYCYDCCVLICRDCIVIDHDGHKYEFVKKIAPQVKEKLSQGLAPLKVVHSSLNSALKTVESTKTDVESSGMMLVVNIKKSFQKLHHIIEQREQELLAQAAKFVDTKFDRLSVQEKKFQTTSGMIRNMVEFVERSIENMTDEELVAIHEQILKEIGEETNKHQMSSLDLKPVEEADMTVDMNCAEELKLFCRAKTRVLASVKRKVVWVDPRVNNDENSGYVHYLEDVEGVSLFATTSASRALEALLVRDSKVEYRAITAGTGGEGFIENLRASGVHCPVLVFTANYNWCITWATRFENVEVTVDPSTMFEFATFERI